MMTFSPSTLMANRLGAGLGNGSAVPFFAPPQSTEMGMDRAFVFINKDLKIGTDGHLASVNLFYSYLLFHFVVVGVS
jgi:hypothetical protein